MFCLFFNLNFFNKKNITVGGKYCFGDKTIVTCQYLYITFTVL